MITSGKPYTLAEVIKRAISNSLMDVHTTMPAKVVKVNMNGQNIKSVDVQPLLKSIYQDEIDTRIVESLPVITDVPVQYPGGAGFFLTFPIQNDDTGTLLFSESSLDKWLVKGGEVDPEIEHRFSLADGIFLPGLRPYSNPLSNAPTDRTTWGVNQGVRIHIDQGSIRLGSDVGTELEPAALATTLKTFLDSLRTYLSGLVLPVTGTAGPFPVAGTAGPPLVAPPVVPTIASATVSVKK